MLLEYCGGVRAFEPIVETVRTGRPGLEIAHGMSVPQFIAAHPGCEVAGGDFFKGVPGGADGYILANGDARLG